MPARAPIDWGTHVIGPLWVGDGIDIPGQGGADGLNPVLVFDVMARGAVGNGSTDDRAAIQAAIDAAETVRGIVFIPPGTYAIGPSNGASPPAAGDYSLKLGTGVTLWFSPNATLVRRFTGSGNANATIRNDDQSSGNTDITIIGGEIDSTNSANTGKHFGFTKVDRLRIVDTSFLGVFGDWNVSCVDCNDVFVTGVYMDSGTTTSEDGLHFLGGARINVSNCNITCGDDALSFIQESNFNTLDMTDIAISNCYVNSRAANAIKFVADDNQTPSNRAIRRVTVSNVVATCTTGQGIIIQDQTNTGLVSDITFANVVFNAVNNSGVIPIDGAVRVTWSNVKIISPQSRIQIDKATDVALLECEVTGTRGANVQNVLIGNSGNCTNIRIVGGHYKGATQHGIQISGSNVSTDIVIENVLIDTPNNSGISLGAGTAGALVKGCRIVGAVVDRGIRVETSAATVTLEGNDLRGNSVVGILQNGTGTYSHRNRFTTGAVSGQAVLVNGTVTVSTSEIQAADSVALTRVVGTGTTRGVLTVGTITGGTSFVIRAEDLSGVLSADDDSTVFWEIVH